MGIKGSLDLSPKQRVIVLKLLKKYIPDTEVWAYGSRVKWTAKPESDLDLVAFASVDQKENIINLREAFEESGLPFQVDFFIWDEVPERFHGEIKNEHIVLQKNEKKIIPKEWQEVKIGDFCPFAYGKGLPLIKRDQTGHIPVYGSGGIVGYHSIAYVQDQGIIIGRKGTIGSVYLAEKPFYPIDTVFYVLKKDKFDLLFTYYLLKSLPLSEMNSDSAIPGLNRENVHRKKVIISKKKIGRAKIGYFLYKIDSLINVNNKINEKLEDMAQSIFKSWFVDFDPIHAKKRALEKGLTTKQVERAAMAVISGICSPKEFAENFKEMDKKLAQKLSKMSEKQQKELEQTASLFPSEFENTEQGKIPRGFSVKYIYEVSDVIGGGTPSTKVNDYYCKKNTGVSWLSPKDLSGYNWKFISNGATDITKLGLEKSSAKLMPAGTIVISSRAPIGYVAIAENELSTNQGFKSLIPKKNIGTNFLYNWARFNIVAMEAVATGSTFKEISGTNMKNLKVILPSIGLIKFFETVTCSNSELQKYMRHETENLEGLRDALLPKILMGEIDLSNLKLRDKK